MTVSETILSVTYTGEPDVMFEFGDDGQKRRFGRDDTQCEIVIWSAINGNELSRAAGVIWRVGDELWVRNLSTRHELYLEVLGRPAEAPLPPRAADGFDRGAARTIPGARTFVRAPGGCELLVRQEREVSFDDFEGNGESTLRVPPVPAQLRPIANALCEPLLNGGHLPASYRQVAERTGISSQKRVRNQVGELCALYAREVPSLYARIAARVEREGRDLGLPADPRLRNGVWMFEPVVDSATGDSERERRRALTLPDYFEVAHLLVRRGLVDRPSEVQRIVGSGGNAR